jgi:predicted  nucleic acid-binding Zn-ribbon protein
MEKEIDELGSGWDAAKERIVQLENEVEAKDGEINQLRDMNKGPWEARGLEG